MASDESTTPGSADASTAVEQEEKKRLDLKVDIESRGACERHITVTVPREEINRYFDEAFSEMMPTAQIPGFRAGRAPRKLVESRYRKEVADQVKGALLVDSIGQITEEHNLAAISEPDLDVQAVEVPEEGPLTFEFNIEVRPEFDLPEWKGLEIERPTREISDADVDNAIKEALEANARLVPHDGPAELGDSLALDIEFYQGDELLSSLEEEVVRLRERLVLADGSIDDFGKLLTGVKAGEQRETTFVLSGDAVKPENRGKEVRAVFKVLEVKRLEKAEITPEFLQQVGGYESEEALRNAVRDSLKRRMEYEQHRRTREHVLKALTASADWELPAEMLRRQAQRELERSVLELRRSGFSEEEIRAHINILRQNSREATAQALREHFILERIAEEENIDATPQEYDLEIYLIAAHLQESPRRVRARLEKTGQMDALRNQIVERKAIQLILSNAKFVDVPFELPTRNETAIDHFAAGQDAAEEPSAEDAGTAEGGESAAIE